MTLVKGGHLINNKPEGCVGLPSKFDTGSEDIHRDSLKMSNFMSVSERRHSKESRYNASSFCEQADYIRKSSDKWFGNNTGGDFAIDIQQEEPVIYKSIDYDKDREKYMNAL